jgi:hypothetical protein
MYLRCLKLSSLSCTIPSPKSWLPQPRSRPAYAPRLHRSRQHPSLQPSPFPAKPLRPLSALRRTRRPPCRGRRVPARLRGTRLCARTPFAQLCRIEKGIWFSKCANRRAAKSAKSPSNNLLALLALPYLGFAARSAYEGAKMLLVEGQPSLMPKDLIYSRSCIRPEPRGLGGLSPGGEPGAVLCQSQPSAWIGRREPVDLTSDVTLTTTDDYVGYLALLTRSWGKRDY